MKVKEINIVWNWGGPVQVVPSNAGRLGFNFWVGACCRGWNEKQMLIDALHIIIRDGVDPMALHKELLKIDEYRAMCANDMPGAVA